MKARAKDVTLMVGFKQPYRRRNCVHKAGLYLTVRNTNDEMSGSWPTERHQELGPMLR